VYYKFTTGKNFQYFIAIPFRLSRLACLPSFWRVYPPLEGMASGKDLRNSAAILIIGCYSPRSTRRTRSIDFQINNFTPFIPLSPGGEGPGEGKYQENVKLFI
jgi:hypothetical protein